MKAHHVMPGTVYLEVACCTSGLCVGCHSRGNHGDRKRRQWRRWTEQPIERGRAERIAANWRDYDPRIVEAAPCR